MCVISFFCEVLHDDTDQARRIGGRPGFRCKHGREMRDRDSERDLELDQTMEQEDDPRSLLPVSTQAMSASKRRRIADDGPSDMRVSGQEEDDDQMEEEQQQLSRTLTDSALEGQDGILIDVLSYLDVPSLIAKKQVCIKWKILSTKAIDQKCGGIPQPFQSNGELKDAVRKYIDTGANPCLLYTSPSPRD